MSARWHRIAATAGEWTPSCVAVLAVEPRRCAVSLVGRDWLHTHGASAAVVYRVSAGQIVDKKELYTTKQGEIWELLAAAIPRNCAPYIFTWRLVYTLTLSGLWEHLSRSLLAYRWSALHALPQIVQLSRGRSRWMVCDLLNYCDLPLSGSAPCYNSLSIDPVSQNTKSRLTDSDCMSSCRSLSSVIMPILERYSNDRAGRWGPTAASLAWSIYRHNYTQEPIYCHGHERAKRLEREAIRGGWCHVFTPGFVAETTTVHDCNSLYPWVMANCRLPTKLAVYSEGFTRADVKALARDFGLLVDCSLALQRRPALSRELCAVAHPPYTGLSVLCGEEALYWLSNGCIRSVNRVALYQMGYPLRQFAVDLYSRRLQCKAAGDNSGVSLYKLILNGLHGKFAQRGRRWVGAPTRRCPDWYDFWWELVPGRTIPYRYRSIAGVVERLEESGELRNTMPAVTAFICAAGRDRLCHAIDIAGLHNTCYCDTDSVHTIGDGSRRLGAAGLLSDTELGLWRVDNAGETSYYTGPKCYRVGTSVVVGWADTPAVPSADGGFVRTTYTGADGILSSNDRGKILVRERTVNSSQANRRLMEGLMYVEKAAQPT